eukprot:CAMPEP_0176412750 /NCGR_PEP_ID=MMETSP0127-20121128/4316_1 /TAXON_ID=938130 /ORGANISM="Platyophrya macrostoma, Strain WH" /LENGTH=504 /DNA_ID=CAMNT_0017792453 /DNA_START=275 /DNA_END=1789 /DNA_ORIENTATION=+
MQALRISLLATHAVPVTQFCEKILGTTITYKLIEWTFFAHFCGGQFTNEVTGTVEALDKQRIGSILDYAAEAPGADGGAVAIQGMKALSMATDLKYCESRHKFDETMALNVMCVVNAGNMLSKYGDGFAAVKLSGLTDPLLLARVSAVQLSLRQAWVHFFSEEEIPLEECRVVVGFKLNDRCQPVDRVREGMRRMSTSQPMSQAEEDAILALLDVKGNGEIDYLRYVQVVTDAVLNPTAATAATLKPYLRHLPSLTDVELKMWRELEYRVQIVMSVAMELGIRVMVDAEQSFYQMAIDDLVRRHQRLYNKHEPMIYNTYQCYLRHGKQRLINDIARAEDEGWILAVKAVRGAYVEQENRVANAHHYASPIWPNADATHRCYNEVATHIMNLIRENPTKPIGVLFGTHNPDSLKLISDALLQLPSHHNSRVAFAQLYGMADHLTVGLANAGMKVYKYIPYGPIKETTEYLGRRASENNSVLKGARPEERTYVAKELLRRFLPWKQ